MVVPAGDALLDDPVRTVHVNVFAIARKPVTNAEFEEFASATSHAGSKWRQGAPTHPAEGLSWADAVAYCRWLSVASGKIYRLPDEREWEKAARGKTGWTYPWGNDWDLNEKRCNSSGRSDGYEFTAPVGACPGVSPSGCYDMVGNVSEWCSEDYPGKSPSKVIRGGCFRDKEWVTTTSRWYERPDANTATVGFRCVTDEKK